MDLDGLVIGATSNLPLQNQQIDKGIQGISRPGWGVLVPMRWGEFKS
jgi:hypothetical protein